MVMRLLISILGISFSFNMIQYFLLDSCKTKIVVQNEMVMVANKQRDWAIKSRDISAAHEAENYRKKLKAIEDKKLEEKDYSCEQSIDLIISAMKEVDNAPDNP